LHLRLVGRRDRRRNRDQRDDARECDRPPAAGNVPARASAAVPRDSFGSVLGIVRENGRAIVLGPS
jgi:hypothetical protein